MKIVIRNSKSKQINKHKINRTELDDGSNFATLPSLPIAKNRRRPTLTFTQIEAELAASEHNADDQVLLERQFVDEVDQFTIDGQDNVH